VSFLLGDKSHDKVNEGEPILALHILWIVHQSAYAAKEETQDVQLQYNQYIRIWECV